MPKNPEGPNARRPNLKTLALATVIAVLAAFITLLAIKGPAEIFGGSKAKYEGMSEFEASRILNELYDSISVTVLPPIKEHVDLEAVDMAEILPDIGKFPILVYPVKGTLSVEIASSPEKASPLGPGGSQHNRWLVEMAERFNKAKFFKKGQQISVSLRSLPSGLAIDYIVSGKYSPDAFTPSNGLWGDILRAKGVPNKLLAEHLVGNVAGIVIGKEKHAELLEKYKVINVSTVAKAVNQGSFVMGYANPLVSSTGANFMMSLLMSVNPKDPLSEEAQAEFLKFHLNVPFVAYTTIQMTEAAKTGVFDGFVYEYQQYFNSPDLRANYVFTPFGVRHDSPIYSIGSVSKEKLEILTSFIGFCSYPDSQALAFKYGFNHLEDYQPETTYKGQFLPMAQRLFKEKKTGDREVLAVFVADVSGSMAGASLRFLKKSLIQGSKAIGYNNYVGLVQFSDLVQIAVPVGRFDLNQRALFTGAVNNMSAGGGTALFDGVIVGAKMLEDAKPDHPGAKLMLIVLSDGESASGHNLREIAPVLKGLKIPVYTVSYNADVKSLKEISAINEAASLRANTDDIVYQMQSFFNAEM
jgi:Ca-activated chloride channel family protein